MRPDSAARAHIQWCIRKSARAADLHHDTCVRYAITIPRIRTIILIIIMHQHLRKISQASYNLHDVLAAAA